MKVSDLLAVLTRFPGDAEVSIGGSTVTVNPPGKERPIKVARGSTPFADAELIVQAVKGTKGTAGLVEAGGS